MILDLSNLYRAEAQHIASVLLALAIWHRGASPERWMIGLFIATMVVPVYVFRLAGLGNINFGPHAWMWVAIDAAATVAFVAVAVNANRNYCLCVAAFQLVAMGAHGARGLVDSVSPFAYAILAIGPSYCQLLVIFVGFIRHVGRERRFGPYREWRFSRRPVALFQL